VTRKSQRGQAIVELAVIFPLIFFVFLGSWTAAALIANNDTVVQAVDYGARVGAEIGNSCPELGGGLNCTVQSGSCQAISNNANDPCGVDDEILSAMVPALKGLTNSTVNEIEIYQPASCLPGTSQYTTYTNCTPGSYGQPVAGDLIDEYEYCSSTSSWELQNGTGHSGSGPCWTTVGVGPYLLSDRTQTIGDEQAIGVELTYTFTSPGLTFFTHSGLTVYTAITFPPEGS
jgi:hypothetical protein